MAGMSSEVNVDDPTVVAAFKSVLLHQSLIALLVPGSWGLPGSASGLAGHSGRDQV